MRTALLRQFEQLVEHYQQDIINFHYRMVGNRFDAENLAQETFIKAFKKISSLKDAKKVKSWFYAIARNVVMDFFRKSRNGAILMENGVLQNYLHAPETDYQATAESLEMCRELEKVIARLDPQDRILIKLLYYEGFSYSEVAQLLSMNKNTVKSRLYRARKFLLEAIRANEILRDFALRYQFES